MAPSRSSAFSQVTALATERPVHAAFAWLHRNPKTIMDWQTRAGGHSRAALRRTGTGRVARRPLYRGRPQPRSTPIPPATSSQPSPPPTSRPKALALLSCFPRILTPSFPPAPRSSPRSNPLMERAPRRPRSLRQRRRRRRHVGRGARAHRVRHSNCPCRSFFLATWAKRARATCAA